MDGRGVVTLCFCCGSGIKFLWWTWHDTDSAIAERMFGVPLGSTMWVITFSATFAYLFRITTAHVRFADAEGQCAPHNPPIPPTPLSLFGCPCCALYESYDLAMPMVWG